ncbi:MAG: hypothetical protein MJZ31_03140 [Bacteroidales bacterium]|nr:hypothetical protein [Bacteroidales bacterium]
MSSRSRKNKVRDFFDWCGKIGGVVALLSIPLSIGLFINNKQHQMEIIKLQQQHNIELQRQHDEFEEKLSVTKDQLEECKHQYRLLEISIKENHDGK